MELLVATLVYTTAGRNVDAQAHIRLVADTVRNAPGLMTSRLYRSQGREAYFLMLTSWDDEESWYKAQERHNPKNLLQETAAEVLASTPQQWLMHYLWGYSRPAATAHIAAVHLANIHPQQIEFAQKGCIEGLRRQAIQSTLAFAFLARGAPDTDKTVREQNSNPTPARSKATSHDRHTILLNLFSWAGEEERNSFYTDSHYRAIASLLKSTGNVHQLPLEPM